MGSSDVEACCASARAADVDVGQHPDDRAGRRGVSDGAPQDEQRAVDQRRVEDAQDARAAVGRQLQRERRRLALAASCATAAHETTSVKSTPISTTARTEPAAATEANAGRGRRADEHRGEHDQRREAAVAGHEVVGEDRDQPLARRVDVRAGDDAGGVAAEAHGHRQRLLAVGAGAA